MPSTTTSMNRTLHAKNSMKRRVFEEPEEVRALKQAKRQGREFCYDEFPNEAEQTADLEEAQFRVEAWQFFQEMKPEWETQILAGSFTDEYLSRLMSAASELQAGGQYLVEILCRPGTMVPSNAKQLASLIVAAGHYKNANFLALLQGKYNNFRMKKVCDVSCDYSTVCISECP